ncbi:hypothetical protein [Halorarius litoreus]|uniref:hypothetical protein n=1 Tax=Halorarius litoreus TaxID=2962676 RepID=UPI0020CE312D|nr:hypothetical protein [Halorarius litoreus]
MDRALALRLDTLIVIVSLLIGGVVTTAFFTGAGFFALLYTGIVGGFIAVFALGVARGGYGGLGDA